LKKERMEQREEKNPIRNGVRNGMFFTLELVMARELAKKISLLYCYIVTKLQKCYMIRNGQHLRQRIIVRHVLVTSVADKNEQTKNR